MRRCGLTAEMYVGPDPAAQEAGRQLHDASGLEGIGRLRAACDGAFDQVARIGAWGVQVVIDEPPHRGRVVKEASAVMEDCRSSRHAEVSAIAQVLVMLREFRGVVVIGTDQLDLIGPLGHWNRRKRREGFPQLAKYRGLITALRSW